MPEFPTRTERFRDRAHAGRLYALDSLERTREWEAGELPETYPWGV